MTIFPSVHLHKLFFFILLWPFIPLEFAKCSARVGWFVRGYHFAHRAISLICLQFDNIAIRIGAFGVASTCLLFGFGQHISNFIVKLSNQINETLLTTN